MDPNNQNPTGNEVPGSRSLEPAPVQPRQPADLRGLMRFAMEAQGENEPAEVSPLSDDRRAFLEQALQSMVIDSGEVLRCYLPILRDKDKIGSLAGKEDVCSEVKNAFDNLSDFTEDLDGADAFCKAGGIDIFQHLYSVNNPELWVMTNNLLAGACQNYPEGQAQALDRGLLKMLLDKLQDPETKHKEKFIYALSGCVRGHSASERSFLALGGVEVLAQCLRSEEQVLQTKAAYLLNYLNRIIPEVKGKLKELNLPQILAPVIDKNIGESTEHLLCLLWAYVYSKKPDVIKQCKNADPPLQIAIRNILDSPTVTNNKKQYRELIVYGLGVLSTVFRDKRPLYDCSEEADR